MGRTEPWRVAVVGFSHGHVGALLQQVLDDDRLELVVVQGDDEQRRDAVCDSLGIARVPRVRSIAEAAAVGPEIAIVCDETARHAACTAALAEAGAHVLVEKPFALDSHEAREMMDAADRAGVRLVVNWPLAYYPSHRTARRLLAEGAIGAVIELQYYDGNRGAHSWLPDDPGPSDSWWLDPERGGGSLHDYLGYGATLATWFLGGTAPTAVSAMVHRPTGLPVDTHAAVIARYDWGLATFQTRWGTLTNPWEQVSAPVTGFVLAGATGVLVSGDYADHVRLHTAEEPEGRAIPVDRGGPASALDELVAALDGDAALTGPATPELSLTGQRIVDAAVEAARTGREVRL